MRSLCSSIFAAAVLSLSLTPVPARAGDDRPPAPAWQLQTLDGKTLALADFKGKVVILNFWATWCPPCVKEIPGFIELQKKYGNKGVAVIGISLDEPSDRAAVQQFAKEHAMNYPVVLGNRPLAEAYGGIEAFPVTYILDRESNVVIGYEGFAALEKMEAQIKLLLEARP